MKKMYKVILLILLIVIIVYVSIELMFKHAVNNKTISNCCSCKDDMAMYDVCCDCTETLNIYEKLVRLCNK